MLHNKMLRAALLGATMLSLASVGAQAGSLTFNYTAANTFSGTPPAGSLSVTIADTAFNNQVTMTITSNLAAGEFVLPSDGFYFNLNPALNVAALTGTFVSDTGSTGAGTFAFATDAFKPDGDGLMDVHLTFSPPSVKAMVGGEVEVYTIQSTDPLSAADFNFLSNCGQGCGTGAHLTAVHVGGTPNGGGGSAWVGGTTGGGGGGGGDPVPEPMSMMLLGTGLIGLGTVRYAKNLKTRFLG